MVLVVKDCSKVDMKILRTPDECFDNLEDYPFEPNYIDIEHHDQTLSCLLYTSDAADE